MLTGELAECIELEGVVLVSGGDAGVDGGADAFLRHGRPPGKRRPGCYAGPPWEWSLSRQSSPAHQLGQLGECGGDCGDYDGVGEDALHSLPGGHQ